MNTAGWIFMLGSIGVVLALLVYCYTKVLGSPDQ
jgi:hypothetical protein